MRINSKQLIGLPVVTKGGINLGKVHSLDIDTENGRIAVFRVKTGNLVKGLLEDDALVDWSQVVEMTKDQLIVSDAAVPNAERVLASARMEGASAGSIAHMDTEPATPAGREAEG